MAYDATCRDTPTNQQRKGLKRCHDITITMPITTRNQSKKNYQNRKWNSNEILRLLREYELLEMPVSDIAYQHKRSEISILNRLKDEGMITDKRDARGCVCPLYNTRESLRIIDVGLDVDDTTDTSPDYEPCSDMDD